MKIHFQEKKGNQNSIAELTWKRFKMNPISSSDKSSYFIFHFGGNMAHHRTWHKSHFHRVLNPTVRPTPANLKFDPVFWLSPCWALWWSSRQCKSRLRESEYIRSDKRAKSQFPWKTNPNDPSWRQHPRIFFHHRRPYAQQIFELLWEVHFLKIHSVSSLHIRYSLSFSLSWSFEALTLTSLSLSFNWYSGYGKTL